LDLASGQPATQGASSVDVTISVIKRRWGLILVRYLVLPFYMSKQAEKETRHRLCQTGMAAVADQTHCAPVVLRPRGTVEHVLM
jgi:hypothetical protein